jgi:hypothetical protein
VDYAGVALLSVGILAFLMALLELGSPLSWVGVAVAVLCVVGLYFVERRAVDPVLPLSLFPDRLFAVATLQGLLAGWAMFGSTNFVPLLGQAVMGLSATGAGSLLTPMMLSWVLASIVGSRLLLRVGYRSVAVTGMVLLSIGTFLMTRIASMPSLAVVAISLSLMGAGMGLAMPAFLIAVQNEVRRSMLGVATSTLQFSRNIGGALGVSVMGAILTASVTSNMAARGIDPSMVTMAALIGAADFASLGAQATAVEAAIAAAIASVFIAALAAAVLALLVTLMAPRQRIRERTAVERREQEAGLVEPEPSDI